VTDITRVRVGVTRSPAVNRPLKQGRRWTVQEEFCEEDAELLENFAAASPNNGTNLRWAGTAACPYATTRGGVDTTNQFVLPYVFRPCRQQVMKHTFQFAFSYRFPYYGGAGRLATVHG
jgi:hypothetical protein